MSMRDAKTVLGWNGRHESADYYNFRKVIAKIIAERGITGLD